MENAQFFPPRISSETPSPKMEQYGTIENFILQDPEGAFDFIRSSDWKKTLQAAWVKIDGHQEIVTSYAAHINYYGFHPQHKAHYLKAATDAISAKSLATQRAPKL